MLLRNCKICKKEFRTYPSVNSFCCSNKCKGVLSRKGTFLRRRAGLRQRVRGENISTNGYFLKNIEKYKDQIVHDYLSCPTGDIYIGPAKYPLMPIKDGFGFYGVKVQDSSRQFLQCCACGEWMRSITRWHLKKCCKIEMYEYKEKYGLDKLESLCADEFSYQAQLKAVSNLERMRNFKKNRMPISQAALYKKPYKQSMQNKNLHGTCPEQVKSRLKNFILRFKELPSWSNKGKTLLYHLRKQYGSPNSAYKILGLPYLKIKGMPSRKNSFIFPDGIELTYDLTSNLQRKWLFEMMLSHCPFLQNQ